MRISVLLPLLLFLGQAIAPAQDNLAGFAIKSGDRVVFYGDSITDQRLYTTFAESFVITRFPTLSVTFTHSGWGGDRVSGGGGGNIDLRLERDVFPYHPTVLTIMLGMNDGAYKPLDTGLLERFQSGYKHIIDSVKQYEPACRIYAIQPSAYDDVTRDPAFEGGYNGVLIRYSQFLKELAAANALSLADLNTPVVEMLRKAKQADPADAPKIINDRVHPGPAGHLVMGAALFKAWNAPALVSSVEVDQRGGTPVARNTKVSGFLKAPSLSWDQLDSSLPLPIDPTDKLINLAVDSSDVIETLDQETLQARNLKAARYELRVDGSTVGTFTKEQLSSGVNLARLDTPMLRQSLLVHRLTIERAAAHNVRWRQIQVPMKNEAEKPKTDAMNALDNLDRELARLQHDAAQPRSHHFELVPV